jgi:hypothetical protein
MEVLEKRQVDFFNGHIAPKRNNPSKTFGKPVVGIQIYQTTNPTAYVSFYWEAINEIGLLESDRIAWNRFDGVFHFTVVGQSERVFGYNLNVPTTGNYLYLRSYPLFVMGIEPGFYQVGNPFEDINGRKVYPIEFFEKTHPKRLLHGPTSH